MSILHHAALLLAAQIPSPTPVADIGVTERLGGEIPADLELVDHRGRLIRFGALTRDRPIVLVLAYYRCPMLCGLVLDGVAKTIGGSGVRPGEDFDLVTISFDPEDGPAEAARRRRTIVSKLGDPEWPFLTADRADVTRLLDAGGVRVHRDPESGQYAHPAVYLVLTSSGRISRYLYGLDVRPFDLELAIAEADQGRSGPSFSHVLLRCFSYDPARRRYGLTITGAFRVGGVVLLFAVGGLLAALFLWERRRRSDG